jgi:hypothetical protein
MSLDYIIIPKNKYKKLQDTNLIVNAIDGQKTYSVHRLILSYVSDFFEKLFDNQPPQIKDNQFVYTIHVPFHIETMDSCIKLLYGNLFSPYDPNECIELVLALNYLQFPSQIIEDTLALIIIVAEQQFQTKRDEVENIMIEFYQLMDKYDIIDTKKKINLQHRMYLMIESHLKKILSKEIEECLFPKFKSETKIEENKFIITEYTYEPLRIEPSQYYFRDMIFTTNIESYHFDSPIDHKFVCISSRPIDEKADITYDKTHEISNRRKSGKEKIHIAKGKIEVFNGLDEPVISSIFIKERDELEFPSSISNYNYSRDYYGIYIHKDYFNLMTKFKITLDF